jgi:hypothetical protein
MSECEYFEDSGDESNDAAGREVCGIIDSVAEISFEEKKEEEVTAKASEPTVLSFELDSEWIKKKSHVFILSCSGKVSQ